MRTSSERVEELHRRMHEMERAKRRRKYLAACTAAGSGCLAVTILIALLAAQIPVRVPDAGGHATGSVFTEHPAAGYIAVAAVAFCLGSLLTAFCFHMKKNMDAGEERHDRAP